MTFSIYSTVYSIDAQAGKDLPCLHSFWRHIFVWHCLENVPYDIWYSKTCVRQPPLKLILVVDVERWLSYKGTCHVILLAKLHDLYLYNTDNFFHINHYLKSVSKVAFLHRFYCNALRRHISLQILYILIRAISSYQYKQQYLVIVYSNQTLKVLIRLHKYTGWSSLCYTDTVARLIKRPLCDRRRLWYRSPAKSYQRL